MENFRRNHMNYSKNESDINSTEEVEEIEISRYDSEDLYPTNINFIIPGNSKFSKVEKSFNVYNYKFPKHKRISKLKHSPICTCKHPNSNCQDNYIRKNIYHIPSNPNICPYCVIENEMIVNPNQSFKTEIPDTPFGSDELENELINQNRNRRDRNNNTNIIKTLPTLYRRETPYFNQKIYYSNNISNSANMPICYYGNINSNIRNISQYDRNNLNFLERTNYNMNKMINNNLFMYEQKTNNFIIDNEPIPPSQINLKNFNKIFNKPQATQNENKDMKFKQVINNSKQKDNKENIIDKQNIMENLGINELNEEKEKNINLEEDNANIDYINNNQIINNENNIELNINNENKNKEIKEEKNENNNIQNNLNDIKIEINNKNKVDNIKNAQTQENKNENILDNINSEQNQKNNENKIDDEKIEQNEEIHKEIIKENNIIEQNDINDNKNEINNIKDEQMNENYKESKLLNNQEEQKKEKEDENNINNTKENKIDNEYYINKEKDEIEQINIKNNYDNKISIQNDNNSGLNIDINEQNEININNIDVNNIENNLNEKIDNEENQMKEKIIKDIINNKNEDLSEKNKFENEIISKENENNYENMNINSEDKELNEKFVESNDNNIDNLNNENLNPVDNINQNEKENIIVNEKNENKDFNNDNNAEVNINNYELNNNFDNVNNDIYNNNFNQIEEYENEDESISQKEENKNELYNTNGNQNMDNYESTNCPKKSEYNILNNQETSNINPIQQLNKKKEINISLKQNLENKINDTEKMVQENIKINTKDELDSSNKKISSGNKNKKSLNKINKENKYKIPQSNELLFNPKISKKKQIEPLFSKYEQLKGQKNNVHSNLNAQTNGPLYKKAIEIFPSQYGTEMYYKNQFRQSDYNTNINSSNKKTEKSNKTTSDKKRIEKTKKENNNVNKELFKIKKYSNKTYHAYKSKIKSDNPFVGLSHYDKNTKERKSLISKTIQKEGDEYSDILIFEDNILNKRILTQEELNQFINILIKFLFEKDEKDTYEHKIGKVINIIKNMNKDEQNKVLNNLKSNTKDEYTNKIYEKIKIKIDEFKDKLTKVYKNEQASEEDEDIIYKLKPKTSNKKVFKK